MKPEYCEPLNVYNVMTNDDNEVLILVPGYFHGEPKNPAILYDGKEHAVMVRDEGEYTVLLEMINEGVREYLYAAKKVLIKELDTKYVYEAEVVQRDINDFAKEALEMHDYYFRLHPYPQRNGIFDVINRECYFCKKKIVVGFQGKMLPIFRTYVTCPQCIRDGKAAKVNDRFFNSNWMYKDMDDRDEIMYRTPPYRREETEEDFFLEHCGRVSMYLGCVDIEDIGDSIWDEIVDNWSSSLIYLDVEQEAKVRQALGDGLIKGQLFRCPYCGQHLMRFVDDDDIFIRE